MKSATRLLLLVPVVLGLGAALVVAVSTGATAAAAPEGDDELGYVVDLEDLDDPGNVAAGEALFRLGCVSCHGPGGVGTPTGPSLVNAGAASAHFYLTTGRMPHHGSPQEQAARKPPVYSPEEIEDLVAYVASLGDGLPIPEVDLGTGHLQEGGDLYRAHCAACHSAAGAGGALSFGQNAPSLEEATPVQIYEAMLIGPGQMPAFGAFTEEEINSIVAYIGELQRLNDPGGMSLGRLGPIPEGFVAIVIGTGGAILAAFLVGRRVHDADEAGQEPTSDREAGR